MNIFSNSVVALSFRLLNSDGELIEESISPVVYLHGGYSGLFLKVEEMLNGKTVGDQIRVSLEPDEAFGDYDPQLIRLVGLSDLPPDVAVGGFLTSGEADDEIVWRVTDVSDGKAVLDGNHELAGQRLWFECTVLDVREATEDEVRHGHVHGDGHCHH
ncbi:MAG: peptidylprolyl isomerase [Burkholderiales bacterium]|jgi:FKBP-type peptidyl-prolyl cis-trans isomerase SlyD|nr:peptidylprolyl isomerase [Burkholderiales bacterium]